MAAALLLADELDDLLLDLCELAELDEDLCAGVALPPMLRTSLDMVEGGATVRYALRCTSVLAVGQWKSAVGSYTASSCVLHCVSCTV